MPKKINLGGALDFRPEATVRPYFVSNSFLTPCRDLYRFGSGKKGFRNPCDLYTFVPPRIRDTRRRNPHHFRFRFSLHQNRSTEYEMVRHQGN